MCVSVFHHNFVFDIRIPLPGPLNQPVQPLPMSAPILQHRHTQRTCVIRTSIPRIDLPRTKTIWSKSSNLPICLAHKPQNTVGAVSVPKDGGSCFLLVSGSREPGFLPCPCGFKITHAVPQLGAILICHTHLYTLVLGSSVPPC